MSDDPARPRLSDPLSQALDRFFAEFPESRRIFEALRLAVEAIGPPRARTGDWTNFGQNLYESLTCVDEPAMISSRSRFDREFCNANQGDQIVKTGSIAFGLAALVFGLAATGTARAQNMAKVRVWHASPDAPAVDVYVNGKAAFTALAFPNATDYAELPAGSYDIQVYPSSANGTGSPVIDVKGLKVEAKPYTVMAIGKLADIAPLVLEDNLAKPAAGFAHVRFVHASPDAPAVDITTTDGTKVFPNVAFGKASAWTPLAAASYDLQARAAGTDTVALEVPGVKLDDGAILTVAATGLLEGQPALAATVVGYEAMAAPAAAPAAASTTTQASGAMPTTLPKTGGAGDWLPLALMGVGAAAIWLAVLSRRRKAVVTND